MNHPTTVVAIPARLESKRLPRKLLADVGGKPLLQRVLERCLEAQHPAAVVLCTDSEELRDKAGQWPLARPVPVVMTPASCSSGSAYCGERGTGSVAAAMPTPCRNVGGGGGAASTTSKANGAR